MIIVLLLLLAVGSAYPAEEYESKINLLSLKGIDTRIVGGEIAKSKQFPFLARLELKKRSAGRLLISLCGGSLISDKVVITAAHCLELASSGTVHLGATRVRSPESTHIAIRVQKNNFVIHEQWSRREVINDIALIILPDSVKINDAVQPVNLPAANQVDLDNKLAVIAGFGQIGNIPGASNELRFVARNILPGASCKKAFPNAFKPTNVCVDGSQQKSACPGDSGGPLVITESSGARTLVGLTSFGSTSCVIGTPAVYTRITSYLVWINQKTGISIRGAANSNGLSLYSMIVFIFVLSFSL